MATVLAPLWGRSESMWPINEMKFLPFSPFQQTGHDIEILPREDTTCTAIVHAERHARDGEPKKRSTLPTYMNKDPLGHCPSGSRERERERRKEKLQRKRQTRRGEKHGKPDSFISSTRERRNLQRTLECTMKVAIIPIPLTSTADSSMVYLPVN